MIRESDDLLIIIRPIVVIGTSGKTICAIQGTRQVFEDIIELREGVDVSSNATIDLLGVTVVSQICMVDEDLHWHSSARKQVAPMEEAIHKTHEFSVPDIIVPLRFCECAGSGSHDTFLSSVIQLK